MCDCAKAVCMKVNYKCPIIKWVQLSKLFLKLYNNLYNIYMSLTTNNSGIREILASAILKIPDTGSSQVDLIPDLMNLPILNQINIIQDNSSRQDFHHN